MRSAAHRLPDAQLGPHLAAYRESVAARRRQFWLAVAVIAIATVVFGEIAEIDLARFAANLWRFPDYIARIFTLEQGPYVGRFVLLDIEEWMWGWRKWTLLLAETLLIAYVGTLLGSLGGFWLCFYAAQNMGQPTWVRVAAKRFLEFCRTVPEIVFALIFVVAFGLGPVPGVLAIAIHTMGALGKMSAEVVENVDMRPVEGTVATGATWSEMIRFAVVPQVLSNFTSYALLRFEINVRGAAIMGFVGAGGIGQDLLEAIRKFYYSDVSAILVLIILTVMLIDLITERVRHALIGQERGQ
jgi:phosphonate transport system permease protein